MKRASRRVIAVILSLLFMIGIVGNVPVMSVVNAETDSAYTVKFESSKGFIFDDENLKEYSVDITKGEAIGFNYATVTDQEEWCFLGYKINGGDTLYITNIGHALNDGEAYLKDYTPVGDVIFEAVYEDKVSITFDFAGGYYHDGPPTNENNKKTGSETIFIKKGEKIDYVPPVETDDSVLLGWTIGDETQLFSREDIANMIASDDITFKANYTPAVFVTLDYNGGYYIYSGGPMDGKKSDATSSTIKIEKGGNISAYGKMNLQNDTGVLCGWKTDGDEKVYTYDELLLYPVEENTTFFAVWGSEVLYQIKFQGNGGLLQKNFEGDGSESIEYSVASGNSVLNDNTIIGWRSSEEKKLLKGWTIEGDSSGTVYNTNIGSFGKLLEGENAIYNITADRDYTFNAYWVDAVQCEFDPGDGYIVDEYGSESGDILFNNEKGRIINEYYNAEINDDTKEFTGWKCSLDDNIYSPMEIMEYAPLNDVKFEAVYSDKSASNKYTITFDGNGGSLYIYYALGDTETGSAITTEVAQGSSIKKYPQSRKCIKDGMVLAGYKVAGDDHLYVTDDVQNENEKYIFEYYPEKDTVFVAQWIPACKVIFNANGAIYSQNDLDTLGGSFTEYNTDEQPIQITTYVGKGKAFGHNYPIGTREGYAFLGLSRSGDDAMYVSGPGSGASQTVWLPTFVVNEDLVFSSEWRKNYTVVFKFNGGYSYNEDGTKFEGYGEGPTGEMGIIHTSVYDGEHISSWRWLDNMHIDEENKVFDGWKMNDSEHLYSAQELLQYDVTADIELVAQWKDADECEHDWGEGVETKTPTCTEKGELTYTCSKCKETKTEKTSALGHSMEKKPAVAATCTTDGNSEYWYCDRCKKYFSDEQGTAEIEKNSWVINATGHNMASHIAVAATCTTDGNSAYWSCGKCNKYFSDAEGTTEIEENSWVINATGHNMESHAAVAATCTAAGNSAYWSCDKCNKYFSDDEGTAEIEENSWVIPATGHNLTKHDLVRESCTTAGNNEYWSCDKCSKYFSDAEGENEIEENSWVIPAMGHNLTSHTAVAATCTEDGNSAYWSCDNCNKYFSDAEGENEIDEDSWIIPAGHKLTKHDAVEATCTEAGNSEYWSCDNCNKYFSDAAGENEIEENSWIEGATGHSLTKHDAVEVTCTEAGNSEYWSCDNCNKYFSDASGENEIEENSWVINTTGHNMESHVAVAATCTTDGNSAYWSCDKCDKYFSDAQGKNEIAENSWIIPAGHKLTSHVAVAATCTADGNSAYWSCDNCNKYFSDTAGENEIAENSWIVEATGHKLTKQNKKAATCTADGNNEYWSCDNCDKCFSDEEGTTEIEKDSCVIHATGHTVVVDKAVAATTTSTGLTEGSHCSTCGAVLKKQQTIPKLQDKTTDPQPEPDKTPKQTEKKYSSEWVDGKWYNEDGTQTYKGTIIWKSNSTGWWIEDTAGWYPTDSWQKIDGAWYYFKLDGYMAESEYYNGYWFNSDGTMDETYYLTWKSNSTGWWVEDKSGWWPSSQWLKIDGSWYYFDGSGYMVTSQYVDGYWIGANGVCQ